MAEFLVELYVSRTDSAAVVDDGAESARLAAEELTREGTLVRYVRSIFVPEDETCFHLYEADHVEDVVEAARRASLPFERVAETLAARPRESLTPVREPTSPASRAVQRVADNIHKEESPCASS